MNRGARDPILTKWSPPTLSGDPARAQLSWYIPCVRREETPVVIVASPCAHKDSATSAATVARAILFGGEMTPDVEARFWAKVVVVENCWEWCGCTSRGYGQFYMGKKIHAAHRVSYELSVGPIPNGLTLDHLCRNRRCVNPSHLEPVTLKENVRRGRGPAAGNFRKTHCPQGHPLLGDNLVVRRGWRECKTCNRAASYRKYKKRLLTMKGSTR